MSLAPRASPLVFYVACVLPTSMMNAKFDEVQWRHLYVENLENIDKVSQEIWSVVLRARVPSRRCPLIFLSLGVPFIFVQ